MRVLIIVKDRCLATVWASHIERMGAEVTVACTQDEAIEAMCEAEIDVIVLNTTLAKGDSALAVADFAGYRHPDARIIFVSNAKFFSDGSVFQHFTNACAMMPQTSPPDDLAAVVEYHALRGAA